MNKPRSENSEIQDNQSYLDSLFKYNELQGGCQMIVDLCFIWFECYSSKRLALAHEEELAYKEI